VVFFGESVPVPVASRARAAFDGAEALLVAGTSLAVFSGYRWVKHAVERGLPVVLVNLGPTRADGLAVLRLEADVAEALPRLAALLDPRR
jgi:NAD-dependent SIR2 family protein deacetylase